MTKMKALTIRQPWVHAIMHLGKRIENRSRRTNYRGPILIHAGAWVGSLDSQYEITREIFGRSKVKPNRWDLPIGLSMLPRGGIVGRANIVDCVDSDPGDPWWMGPFGWILDDVQPVEFIPCRGKLGLWDFDAKGFEL